MVAVEPLVGSAVRTVFDERRNSRWSAQRTLHRFDEPIVEQPRAGVLQVGGGDEVIAPSGDKFGESGAVQCADGEKTLTPGPSPGGSGE